MTSLIDVTTPTTTATTHAIVVASETGATHAPGASALHEKERSILQLTHDTDPTLTLTLTPNVIPNAVPDSEAVSHTEEHEEDLSLSFALQPQTSSPLSLGLSSNGSRLSLDEGFVMPKPAAITSATIDTGTAVPSSQPLSMLERVLRDLRNEDDDVLPPGYASNGTPHVKATTVNMQPPPPPFDITASSPANANAFSSSSSSSSTSVASPKIVRWIPAGGATSSSSSATPPCGLTKLVLSRITRASAARQYKSDASSSSSSSSSSSVLTSASSHTPPPKLMTYLTRADRLSFIDFLGLFLPDTSGLSSLADTSILISLNVYGDVEATIHALLSMDDSMRPKMVTEIHGALRRYKNQQVESEKSIRRAQVAAEVQQQSDDKPQVKEEKKDSGEEDHLDSMNENNDQGDTTSAFQTFAPLRVVTPSLYQYESHHAALSAYLATTRVVGIVTSRELDCMLDLTGGELDLLISILDTWKLGEGDDADSKAFRKRRHSSGDLERHHRANASSSSSAASPLYHLPTSLLTPPPRALSFSTSVVVDVFDNPHHNTTATIDLSTAASAAEAAAYTARATAQRLSAESASSVNSIESSLSASPIACASSSVSSPPLLARTLISRLKVYVNAQSSALTASNPSSSSSSASASSSSQPGLLLDSDAADMISRVLVQSQFSSYTDADRCFAQDAIINSGLLAYVMPEESVVFTAQLLDEILAASRGRFHLRTLLTSLARTPKPPRQPCRPQNLSELIYLLSVEAKDLNSNGLSRRRQPLSAQIARAKREVERQDRAAAAASAAHESESPEQQHAAHIQAFLDEHQGLGIPQDLLLEMAENLPAPEGNEHLNEGENDADVSLNSEIVAFPPAGDEVEDDPGEIEFDIHGEPIPKTATKKKQRMTAQMKRNEIISKLLASGILSRCPLDSNDLIACDIDSLARPYHGHAYLLQAITLLGKNGVKATSFAHLKTLLHEYYAHSVQVPVPNNNCRRKSCVIL